MVTQIWKKKNDCVILNWVYAASRPAAFNLFIKAGENLYHGVRAGQENPKGL